MTGWKTWLAAIGMMATGISLISVGLLADPIDGNQVRDGVLTFLAGLAMIGIGHKIEKTLK